jgi:hypothetical protein
MLPFFIRIAKEAAEAANRDVAHPQGCAAGRFAETMHARSGRSVHIKTFGCQMNAAKMTSGKGRALSRGRYFIHGKLHHRDESGDRLLG